MRILLALLAILVLAVVTKARDDAQDDAQDEGVLVEHPAYVGAEACAQCHREQYQAWTGASHATTLLDAAPWNLPADVLDGKTVLHPPGSTRFEVVGEGDDRSFFAQTTGPEGATVRYPLTHIVGKRRIHMFLTRLDDGRLQVLPGMLEIPTGVWFDYTHLIFGQPGTDPDVPPVIDPGSPSFWSGPVRAFGPRCSGCHVSGDAVEPPSAEGRIGRRTWRRMGVDCERCHGPGAKHGSAEDVGEGVLSFKDLDRHTSLSVCLRCHMEGEKVDLEMAPGKDLFEHLDPTLLDDPGRADAFGRPVELIYDGLSFLVSRCATEGGLVCTSCHDPHGSGHVAQLRHARDDPALCARCHADIVAQGSAHTHHPAGRPGSGCVDCHMPYLEIERGHGVMTDHTISIPRPDAKGDRLARDACRFCHEGGRAAPADAPRIEEGILLDALARWWPDRKGPRPWEAAVGAAREDMAGGAASMVGLMTVLADIDAPRLYRATALRLLARHPEAAKAALLLYAGDADSLLRREAIGGLAGLRGKDIDARLREALADPSKPVRRRAARAALRGWWRVQADADLLRAILPVLEQDALDVPDDDGRWFRLGAARELAGDVAGAARAYGRQVALDQLNPHVPAHLETLRKR